MSKQEALNQAWYELRDSLNPKSKLWPIIIKLKAAIDMNEGLEREQFSDTYRRIFVSSGDEEGRTNNYKAANEGCNPVATFPFSSILKEMQELYNKKNHDYGNSFSETIQEFGFKPAIARINDKFKRVKQMVKGEQMQVNESMRDNLIDIANYCILTIIEIDNQTNKSEK